MNAAHTGWAECVRRLLPGSDPAAKDLWGNTALFLAAVRGRAECVEALLGACDPNAKNGGGHTPLMGAVSDLDAKSAQKSLECARLLMRKTDLGAKNNDGETVFGLCSVHSNWAAADLLSEIGDPDEAEKVFSRAGPEKMPRWAAKKEAEALALAAGMARADSGAQIGEAKSEGAPGAPRKDGRTQGRRAPKSL